MKIDKSRFITHDLTGLRGTELYIDEEAEEKLLDIIGKDGVNGIHLLDNGNYHYVTRLFLHHIKEEFDLLYFDNHSDDQMPAFAGIKSCGSWVLDAKDELKGKLKGISWIDGSGVIHQDGEPDTKRPLYISIDKDVLSKEIAPTNWDQGEISLGKMTGMIDEYLEGRTLIGVDICGECLFKNGFADEKDICANEKVDNYLIEYFYRKMEEAENNG